MTDGRRRTGLRIGVVGCGGFGNRRRERPQSPRARNRRVREVAGRGWYLGGWLSRCGAAEHPAARERLDRVLPTHPLVADLRSAAAMAPEFYYARVAAGQIQLRRAEFSRFVEAGVELSDGSLLPCDQVLLCVGLQTPRFPFLPEKYRQLLEAEPDGPQLYRHLMHRDIPDAAFGESSIGSGSTSISSLRGPAR